MKYLYVFCILISLSACGFKNNSKGEGSLDVVPTFNPTNLTKALNSASRLLVQRLPTTAEATLASQGIDQYEKVIRQYLATSDFMTVMRVYHENFFEMGGMGPDGVNYEEPTNLALYIIKNNMDYREILKASYCVDNNLNKTTCSSFAAGGDPTTNAAGVLTTQAFLKKWVSAFSFRRTKKAFLDFSCSEYPDADDPGLSPSQLPGAAQGAMKPFNKTSGEAPICYNCHRTINPRALMYFNYNENGQYTADTSNSVFTDAANPTRAKPTDLLLQGAVSVYHDDSNGGAPATMSNMKQYGELITRSKGFQRCVAQRFVNFVFNKPVTEALPSDMTYLIDTVKNSKFNVREVLVEILKSPGFVLK